MADHRPPGTSSSRRQRPRARESLWDEPVDAFARRSSASHGESGGGRGMSIAWADESGDLDPVPPSPVLLRSIMSVLPHTLLILVHLHLLDYPLNVSSSYNERLFDPTRTSLRERTKTLEDIAYFLVGNLEGTRGRARSILPTYPCIQPSDITAFRVSLSKYLETLKHSSIYPSRGDDKQKNKDQARGPTTKNSDAPQPQAAAWWWQDVVVRKSLLEECSGERFECLLLAFSTHALFVNTARLSVPGSVSQAEVSRHVEALQTLPRAYARVLELSQSARREWERTASRLVQQQEDLSVLRQRLLDPTASSSSKFDSLSTGRLLALRDSRLQDLLTTWKDEGGRRALHFLIDLAGLEPSSATNDASRPLQASDVAQDKADDQCTPPTLVSAPPLPIAAANHPGNLAALNAPLIKNISTNADASEGNTRSIQDPTKDRLAERVASIERTHQALLDAALRLDNVRLGLERRMRKGQPGPVTCLSPHSGIYEVPSRTPIDFRTPDEAPSSSTAEPLVDKAVEERIARIRNTLLPAWPELISTPSPSDLELEGASSSVAAEASCPPRASQMERLQAQYAKGSVQIARVVGVALQVQKPKVMDKPRTLNTTTGASKVSAKVSRRASAARARRTTLLLRHNLYDDEVSRIVDAVEDGSPTFEPTDSAQTPKNRLGTAGSLLSTVKKTLPRPSFDIDKHERAIDTPLPKLRLSSLDTHDLHGEISLNGHDFLPATNHNSQSDADEEEFYEGHSVTLREILLKATDVNGPQYDLLAEDEDDMESEGFEW